MTCSITITALIIYLACLAFIGNYYKVSKKKLYFFLWMHTLFNLVVLMDIEGIELIFILLGLLFLKLIIISILIIFKKPLNKLKIFSKKVFDKWALVTSWGYMFFLIITNSNFFIKITTLPPMDMPM